MPRPLDTRARYMPGMDGLRAVAVLAVIAYHIGLPGAAGGLLGVGVFFVISGYLITDLLVAEWDRRGSIHLGAFWARRARRLLPALFAMIVIVVLLHIWFRPVAWPSLPGDALAATFYYSNWWYIFHHISYFARFGPPSPLTHLWSLAVEEQFYLIWPLMLLAGLATVRRRVWLVGITLILALLSALWMAHLYQPGTDPSRVYYGTDTRAFGLLVGAGLALWRPSRRVRPMAAAIRNRLDLLGGAGLAAIVALIIFTNQYQTFLYRGGMLILALATAMSVQAVAQPGTRLERLLGASPLRWLGVRSYGIYLWHYPVIVLTTPAVDTGGFDPLRAGAQVAAAIILAALSWRFLEEPIRQGALVRLATRLNAVRLAAGSRPVVTRAVGLGGAGVLLVAVSGFQGPLARPAAAPGTLAVPAARALLPPDPALLTPPPRDHRATSTTAPARPSAAASVSPVQASASSPSPSASAAGPATVTAIGDSVMVDAKPYLDAMWPDAVVDGQVGLQLIDAGPLVQTLRARGQMGQLVVVELGTNGPYTATQLVQFLDSLGPVRHVFLVNTRVPRPWQGVVNQTISQVAASFPHASLIDWYNASANENGWFYPDGVHLNPTGARAYATLIMNALRPYLNATP
jgi:peptidoglycan/LPS O-acetylase OafA/YrhL/lysophospholipase L1-like esterase